MNLIFCHFNCSERLLKSHHVFLVPVVAACSQLLSKRVSKLFENVEWSNSLLKHFKIQTLLKINCSMAAISASGVRPHSQSFSLFFRNRIQCIALYQLHNSSLCSTYAVATVEVHSLSSDQVFLSIPVKTFPKFSGWTFKCCLFLLFNCSIVYFTYLRSKAAI